MAGGSPWEPTASPEPQFKEMPETNPRTGKPPVTHFCGSCGAQVVNRRIHLDWHRDLDARIRSASQGF